MESNAENIVLSPPQTEKGLNLLLQSRQSKRQFLTAPLTLNQVSSLLWACGGKKVDAVTAASRTIPSAGGTFPLEIYLVVGKDGVKGMSQGIFHYSVEKHALELLSGNDARSILSKACRDKGFLTQAPASIVIGAIYNRTTNRYGDRGVRYVHMEVGHACQNVYLMAVDLGLATVEVGAFDDTEVKKALGIADPVEPLIVLPLGYPA